jgi:iron complex outermembrane receptor protein
MNSQPSPRRSARRLTFTLLAGVASLAVAWAQPAAPAGSAGRGSPATGAVIGRVLNTTSGNYLNNARVVIEGTRLEAFTDESGDFRFGAVPAGVVRLTASFAGLGPQSATLTVPPGGAVRHEFELALEGTAPGRGGVLVMEAFTVQASELTAQAVALQERRNAPNIKNVVAIEADMGEGNVGEFLKAIPGLAQDLNPQSPSFASIRGMPNSGTIVTTDGAEVATSGISGRAVDLGLAATGNIDRIEVSKVPTPDMPANAVGGSINLISKSAFSRRRPLLTYNAFGTFTTRDGYRSSGLGSPWGRSEGPDPKSDMPRINPALNLSYLRPISDALGLTFSLSHSNRYTDWDFRRPSWNKVQGLKLSENINPLPFGEEKLLVAAKADWRRGRHQLSASASYSTQDIFTRQFPVVMTFGAGATGDGTHTQGAATGVGTASMSPNGNNQDKRLSLFSVSHRYTGGRWSVDTSASLSKSRFKFSDLEDGFFSSLAANVTNLVLRQDFGAPEDTRIGVLTALNRAGAPVDVYDGSLYSVNSAGSAAQTITDEVARAGLNVARDFGPAFPLVLKTGVAINRKRNDIAAGARSWTFTPPGGAAGRVAANHDLIADNFSSLSRFTDLHDRPVRIRFLSVAKLKALYDANPAWFVLDQTGAHINAANASKEIEETITSAYVRGDLKFLDNRLWLAGGVRFERTEDEGAGVLNDIRRTYQQDSSGRLILDAAGRPIRVTTNALEIARLQYTRKGSRAQNSYDGFYPSLNTSYTITPGLVARAAYARTIGRPNFPEIIPGLTITDPGAVSTNRTITAINGALRPWSADNFDLTLELYETKGATASVSLFRKDITGFFVTNRGPATPERLEEFGLSDDYLDYDIITKRNGGNARLTGVEVEYRQSLLFLPAWARGTQVFGNVTSMDLGGANADDFSGYTAKTGNWGVSFTRPRFSARVAVNYTGLRRIAIAAASGSVRPGSYTFYAPQTRLDLAVSWMLHRRVTAYLDIRNLTGEPLRRGTWSADTPHYARLDVLQFAGAMFTLGLRGQF